MKPIAASPGRRPVYSMGNRRNIAGAQRDARGRFGGGARPSGRHQRDVVADRSRHDAMRASCAAGDGTATVHRRRSESAGPCSTTAIHAWHRKNIARFDSTRRKIFRGTSQVLRPTADNRRTEQRDSHATDFLLRIDDRNHRRHRWKRLGNRNRTAAAPAQEPAEIAR